MPIMLSSTSLFSSSGPTAPLAPLGPPCCWLYGARLPGLPLLASDRRLALDYTNLNALFIHPRINSHPREPVKGSVGLLINHWARAGRPGCPSAPGRARRYPSRSRWRVGLCSPRAGGSARRAVQPRPRDAGGSDGSRLLRSGSAHCAGRASPARPLQAKRGGNPRRRPPVLPSAPLPPERALGERGATPPGQGPLQRTSNGTRFA